MDRLGNLNIIRLGFILAIVTGGYILLSKQYINEQYMTRLTQQKVCSNMGGNWLFWENECEVPEMRLEVFESVCNETGGEFTACASPCRNSVNNEVRVCQAPCYPVCRY